MATDPSRIEELARQLAALPEKDRAELLARFASDHRAKAVGKPVSEDFKPPVIKGGTWTGGTLRREELYGDDGR